MRARIIAAAAILSAGTVHAQERNVDALLQNFLDSREETVEACFGDMPEMDAGLRDADFRSANQDRPVEPRRLVVAFDASGSMAGALGSRTKMEAAREAVDALLEEMPEDVTLGLVAFGHRGTNDDSGRAESCAGVEALVDVASGSIDQLRDELAALEPAGWTPLAAGLEEAGRQLMETQTPGEQVIYVVSDGEETCGGDPVAAARALHEGDIRAVVNILGLDLPAADREQLEAVADAGGGLFTSIESESELARSIEEMRRQNSNSVEVLRSRNQSAGTQLRNSNVTFSALLQLDNCVAGRALRESNGLYSWMRDNETPPEVQQILVDTLNEGHDAYLARAAAIREEAESARDDANSDIEQRLEETEEDFEGTR